MNNVSIDSSQVAKLFDSLNTSVQKEIMMKGLAKGGKVLQSATKERLLQKMPKAQSAMGKSKKTMVDSIRMIKDKAYTELIVSIMSNYLTVFFEGGTDKRYLKKDHKKDSKHHKTYKKGEYRGQIKPLNFFADARQQSEKQMIDAITEEIMKEINKLEQ